MSDDAYAALIREICVELGFCGSVQGGKPLHVGDLIPADGSITSDHFAELAFIAEGLDPADDPKGLKAAIKTTFERLLGGQTVDAAALH